MQGHMFWALFIHAQDAQDIAGDPEKQQDVWNDLRDLRQLFRATPWQRGQTSLRHVPPLEDCLLDYYTRGAYDEYWNRIEHDYTQFWDRHADIPGDVLDRVVRPVPGRRLRVLRGDGRAEHGPAAPRHRPVEPRRDARGRDVLPRRRLRAAERLGCRALLRGAARVLLPLAARRRVRPCRGRGAGADLRHGRRLRPSHAGGQARPRRRVARGVGVAAGSARRDALLPPLRRLTLDPGAACRRRAAAVHLRSGAPGADDRRPLLRDRRAAGGGRRDGTGLGAVPEPGAPAARPAHARSRGPEGVARVLRLGGAVPPTLRTAGRARLPDRAAWPSRSR